MGDMKTLEDMNLSPERYDPPILTGGQGRSGEDLEAEAMSLTWTAIGVILIIDLLIVGVWLS